MGVLFNMLSNAMRESEKNRELTKRYETDPSRGFHDLEPYGEVDSANSACYLQNALRVLGSEPKTLKIVLPDEAVLPDGWFEVYGDYVLIDDKKRLYGTLSIQILRYLGLELGDHVTVERKRENGEYFLNVYSNSNIAKALQDESCELCELNIPASSSVHAIARSDFGDPRLRLIPTPKGSKAKPHIGIYDNEVLIYELSASMSAYKTLIKFVDQPIQAIHVRRLNSTIDEGHYYKLKIAFS